MKKKYSKIAGIFCVVVATLLLLIMLISKDFGIFYILITAFSYYVGIKNIKQRLSQMLNASVDVTSVLNEGTKTVITIPKEDIK